MQRYLIVGLTSIVFLAGCQFNQTATITPTDENTTIEAYSDEDITVVTSDVYGKDLDIVERYPESVRSYYLQDDYSTSVTYQTTASENDLRTFYADALKKGDWTMSEEATDYVEYTKGSDENPEIFTLWLTPYPKLGLVEYELSYERALTDSELKDYNDETEEF